MTEKLPALAATFNQALETDARALADDWIKQYSEPTHGVFHHSFSLKPAMRLWALHHPFGADDIVMFAEGGSQEAHEVLTDLAGEEINEGRLTVVLANYTLRQLKRSREPKKPGPTKLDKFRRDIGIMLLVHTLMKEFNLAAHHNPASRRPSASKIAADALTAAGIDIVIGHRGVAKIWDRYGPIWTGKFPAGYLGPLG
jgi:hypothetical protein